MTFQERVVLVTGRLAAKEVRQFASTKGIGSQISVEVLPVSVAAFITPQMLDRASKQILAHDPDLILVPGLTRANFKESRLNSTIPIRKGPRLASQIPELLSLFPKIIPNLSSSRAADWLVKNLAQKRVKEIVLAREKDSSLIDDIRNYAIDYLKIGRDFPIRVVAEIVDAPTLSLEDVRVQATYYKEAGADIIDIGAIAGESNPDEIASCVEEVHRLGIVTSVDSLNPGEIKAGVDAGANLVLSVDFGNWKQICDFIPENVAMVVLPTSVANGKFPKSPRLRAEKCKKLVQNLKSKGYTKLLPDLILESGIVPGLFSSLFSFYEYRKQDENIPLFAGSGNVTEFIDADSSGVNATITTIAQELGIAALLTTEVRPACIGATRELNRAAWMTFAAECHSGPPKKVGYDSFFLKSDLRSSPIPSINSDDLTHVETLETSNTLQKDPTGVFRIWVDHKERKIFIEHRKSNKSSYYSFIPNSKSSPESIVRFFIEKQLLGTLDHAAYLGAEITKAEIALMFGRSYIQDMEWFIHDDE